MTESSLALEIAFSAMLSVGIAASASIARRRQADPWTWIDSAVLILVLTPLISKAFLLALLPDTGLAALPLHVCDFAGLFCAISLVTRNPSVTTVGVLTALVFSSVAIVQPDLGLGPSPIERLLFWTRHISLVVAPIYLVFALCLVPSWRGYRFWVMTVVGYVGLMIAVNTLFGTSFGYLAAMPSAPAVLVWFGPWPWRLIGMVGPPIVIGALVTLGLRLWLCPVPGELQTTTKN